MSVYFIIFNRRCFESPYLGQFLRNWTLTRRIWVLKCRVVDRRSSHWQRIVGDQTTTNGKYSKKTLFEKTELSVVMADELRFIRSNSFMQNFSAKLSWNFLINRTAKRITSNYTKNAFLFRLEKKAFRFTRIIHKNVELNS